MQYNFIFLLSLLSLNILTLKGSLNDNWYLKSIIPEIIAYITIKNGRNVNSKTLKPKFIPTFRAVYKVVFDQDKVFTLYEMQIDRNRQGFISDIDRRFFANIHLKILVYTVDHMFYVYHKVLDKEVIIVWF